jgi:(p)ppGpp synthase/HD superfamily hydrolase
MTASNSNIREVFMHAYSQRYQRALELAARAHRSQTRKGSDLPYLTHPVHVSILLLRHGFGEAVAIAGLLHDVVEDSEVPLAQLEAEFGPNVAEMVEALTEKKRENGCQRPWEIRKQEALAHLREASDGAVAVKAADALHNAHTLARQLEEQGRAAWRHYSRGPERSLWYYRRVAAEVDARLGDHPLALELKAAVESLARTIDRAGNDQA